ncbi:ribosome biogenesis regulatory protein homolog [Sitophilus oryzae]|uniref:Ribosome biogenesis regulatory protein n=1 Tax=Sitophilus oryzae TaxID=7048 RepID=A0A6J2Y6C1_SITOR|nr:ribosome biogenesis regulatory protein homolog [Sitophilus oryzae]
MDVVSQILEKSAQEAEKYKPITVEKHLELEIDLGTLLAVDTNEFDTNLLKRNADDYFLKLTRDNTQLLINQLWELPTEKVDEAIMVRLPTPKTLLPRMKPVPRPRPLTKWQKFANEKGIQKKKKSKLSWDEQLQKWIPMYGFKRAKADSTKNWVLEVPQNVDPYEDQFAKKTVAKSENVAKNELQRLRNIAKAKKVKVPRAGVTNPEVSSAKDLQAAVTVAKASTASLGKFQDNLPKEKKAKGVAPITPGVSRKRKLPPASGEHEKKENLNIVDSILNKRPKLDIEKAISKQIQHTSENSSSSSKGIGQRLQSREKQNRSKLAKKPKSGNGIRKGGKKGAGGRKRR